MASSFCATVTRQSLLAAICALFGLLISAATVYAQQPFCVRFGPNDNGLPPGNDVPTDLFLAIQEGSVEAKMIVRSQYQARLILTNPTGQMQSIQVPDVLAARPILAQQQSSFFGPQSNSGSNVGSTGAIAPQTVGGSPQGSSNRSSQNSGFPSMGNGNNIFNIAPEQVRTVEIKCLCLEHGKPNPRSAVKYELVPLDEVNDDPKLVEVLKSYGRGEANRDVAQAAAWHLSNEMSWEKLAGLSQKVALNASRPWFSTTKLRQARELVEQAQPQTAKVTRPAIKEPKL